MADMTHNNEAAADGRTNLTELAEFFPTAKPRGNFIVTQISELCWAYSGPGFCGTRRTKAEAEAAALSKFSGVA